MERVSGKLRTSYSVSALISSEDEAARKDFARRLRDYASDLKAGLIGVDSVPPRDLSYCVTISDRLHSLNLTPE